MASQVLADDTQVQHRNFHGRTIKVTMCDADPEFTSKVARIQDDIISRIQVADTANGLSAFEEGITDESGVPLAGESVISHDAVSCELEDDIISRTEVPDIPNDIPTADESGIMAPVTIESMYSQDTVSTALNIDVNQLDVGIVDGDVPEEKYEPIIQQSPAIDSVLENAEMPSKVIEPESVESIDVNASGTEYMTTNDEVSVPTQNMHEDLPQHILTEFDGNDSEVNFPDAATVSCPEHGTGLSVFNNVELTNYAEYEWKGTTPKAAQMRHGYQQIIRVTSQSSMRKIRGDNYCGLRATCFQILSQRLGVLKTWDDTFDDLINIPQILLHSHRCSWLTQWSFAGRLKVTPKKRLDTLKNCLQTFCDELQISRNIDSDDERIDHFLSYFNSGKPDEVLLFEAMKLLMLHAAVLLHERMAKEEDVPVFAWLLFARDTSESPEKFMLNHLNAAGDTGGLEQVEMFLLGYALSITIRVLRPSQVGEEDFVTHYPDDHPDDWDICNLIAEDDRHYNIVVP